MLIVIGYHDRDGPTGPDPIVNRDDLLGMVINMASQADAINQHVGRLFNARSCETKRHTKNATIAIACDVSSK